MTVELRTLEPRQAVVLEHRGPYSLIGEKFGALAAFQASHPANYGAGFALFYSDTNTTPEAELRSVAGVFVDGEVPAVEAPFASLEVAGGDYAVTVHNGNYEGLPESWRAFMHGPMPHGYTLGENPPLEIYLSMSEVDGGAASVTELLASVRRA